MSQQKMASHRHIPMHHCFYCLMIRRRVRINLSDLNSNLSDLNGGFDSDPCSFQHSPSVIEFDTSSPMPWLQVSDMAMSNNWQKTSIDILYSKVMIRIFGSEKGKMSKKANPKKQFNNFQV